MRIIDAEGNRLYLTSEEKQSFLHCAKNSTGSVRSFAETLVYTGCRISEALQLKAMDINRADLIVTINSLKKRRGDIYRNVPVPDEYMDALVIAHDLIKKQKNVKHSKKRLWPWSRQYGYNIIKSLMIEANIPEGKHRSPKGLRHAYGINAISKDVPLNMIQKWMGHADITTTAIYANAIGKQEKAIADKMWPKIENN